MGREVERQRREARQLPDPRAQGRHVRELLAVPKVEKYYQIPHQWIAFQITLILRSQKKDFKGKVFI